MDREQLEEALKVRYVKLHFKVRIREDTRLPMNKVSALRGGIGEMLLRANCIRDRKCGACDFEEECIVRRTMYSRFPEGRKPSFVTTGESVGYVLECEDYREEFSAGDTLGFQLVLLGRTIVYFSQFLQAICQLGYVGLGKDHSAYDIISVRNTRGKEMLKGQDILMEHYQVETLGDHVRYRLNTERTWENHIRFKTPVTLKYQGVFQDKLTPEAVIPAIFRRLYILDCFEGIDCRELGWQGEWPGVTEEASQMMNVYRYSGTQDKKMSLRGVKGHMVLSHFPEDLLPVLLAGEVTHIGKNTSFGFGRYHIS